MKKILVIIGLAILLAFIFGSYFVLGNYSQGTRAGVVQKLSRKGIVIKTWEGQLNLGGFNTTETGGVGATIWDFSVKGKNQLVLDELEKASLNGKRVKLYYTEKFLKLFWIGETKYFVHKVEPFENIEQ